MMRAKKNILWLWRGWKSIDQLFKHLFLKNFFMKKIIQIFACFSLCAAFIFLSQNTSAQSTAIGMKSSGKSGFGFRVGLNYAKVSGNSDSIQYRYKPGLMIAVFLAPPNTGVIGYRSELLYSKEGFDYTGPDGTTGT